MQANFKAKRSAAAAARSENSGGQAAWGTSEIGGTGKEDELDGGKERVRPSSTKTAAEVDQASQ